MKCPYGQGDIDLRAKWGAGEGEDHLVEYRGAGGQEEKSCQGPGQAEVCAARSAPEEEKSNDLGQEVRNQYHAQAMPLPEVDRYEPQGGEEAIGEAELLFIAHSQAIVAAAPGNMGAIVADRLWCTAIYRSIIAAGLRSGDVYPCQLDKAAGAEGLISGSCGSLFITSEQIELQRSRRQCRKIIRLYILL